MAQQPTLASLFTTIDVSRSTTLPASPPPSGGDSEQTALLRQLVEGMERQNRLLEEMAGHMAAPQRQRASQMEQWRKANPALSRQCREAAEILGRVQTDFLQHLADEVESNGDRFGDGGSEFFLNEFVDRFGPRLAHLTGVLQVLGQLGNYQPTPE